jgi:hypothetical protein
VILGTVIALLDCLLRQVMLEGTFHADPHPGKVLLLAGGRLGLLDFGSVGRIDAGLRTALQRLLLALDRGDPAGLADALLEVLLHQVILVALAATSGVMAVLMLGLHGGPAITKTVTLYAFFGYCLLVIAAILALRVLVLVFRPDTR